MQFASYADFRAKVQQLFDGDDISQSDISVGVLDLIIGAGEARIYRDVRSSTLDAPFSLTTTGNAATLPSDFIELRQGPFVAGYVQATYVPTEVFQNISALYPRSTTHPVRYTLFDDTLQFYPALGDGSVVTGRYYRQFPDLVVGGLNAFFDRWEDLFVYAALAESAPFLGELQRLPIWEAKYKDIANSVNETERRRATRGSKLQMRVG